MDITIQDISDGLVKWAEHDLLNKGTLFQQGVAMFVYLQAKPRINNLLSSLTMLSDDGVFELEELEHNLRKALDKMGGVLTLPVIDYTIDADDLDTLFKFIKESKR